MSNLSNPKWRNKFNTIISVLTLLLSGVSIVFYSYWIITDQYLDSWYLKISVGIACFGAFFGTIIHELRK
tara:strand:- start:384 stop:593 length:210 start_codon:yes stop_codon:yes gene_type:complete